jgi:hypothetical protein
VTLSGFPKQTDDATTKMTISYSDSNRLVGDANINIPDIGRDNVEVIYDINKPTNDKLYSVIISDIPGQTAKSDNDIHAGRDCPGVSGARIDIPGIGSGFITTR